MWCCTLDVLPGDMKKVVYDTDLHGFAFVLKKGRLTKTAGKKARVVVPLYPVNAEVLGAVGDCARQAEKDGLNSCALVVDQEKHRLGFIAL